MDAGTAPDSGQAGRWWPVGLDAQVRDGAAFGAHCDGHPIAVYCVAGALYATDSLCTHALVPLEDGLLDGFEIECPVHQARFDVRTGACTQFPATRPLRAFQVRRHEGQVEVWISEGTVPARGVRRAAGALR